MSNIIEAGETIVHTRLEGDEKYDDKLTATGTFAVSQVGDEKPKVTRYEKAGWDDSIMSLALEVGFALSTQYGQVPPKLMPISDFATLKHFADKIKSRIKARILEKMPEAGITWMQEGFNKDRKGYTEGFNKARTEMKNIIEQLSP